MQVKDTETGDMISYALWQFFDHAKVVGDNNEERIEKASEAARLDNFPTDANVEAIRVLFANAVEKRDEMMKGFGAYACM